MQPTAGEPKPPAAAGPVHTEAPGSTGSLAVVLRRLRDLLVLAVLASAALLGALQLTQKVRFNIGAWDRPLLADAAAFEAPQVMRGPVRQPDGSVREEAFDGRLTRWTAALRLPYQARGQPLELRIRCHRFGLGGVVTLVVNGRTVEHYPFDRGSYPWAGIAAIVADGHARGEALEVQLITRGGDPAPDHLPADFGVGIDWVQVAPRKGRVLRLPTTGQWGAQLALVLSSFLVLKASGVGLRRARLAAGLLALLAPVALALRYQEAFVLLRDAWLAPALAYLIRGAFLVVYRRSPEAALRATTVVVGAALGLATLETGLRARETWLARRPTPIPSTLPLLEPDPVRKGAYWLRPNLDLSTRVPGYEVRIRTNSHGMHWREVPLEAEGGRERVAFLGDSFTFGCWVDDVRNSFVGVFETSLRAGTWEALNFGVGGYGLAESELLLEEKALAFSPRYVVLVVFVGNDFRDTYLGLGKDRIVDGTAVLDPSVLAAKVPEEYLRKDRTIGYPSRDPSPVRRALGHLATFRLLAPWLHLENLSREFAVNRQFTSYSFWSQYPYPEVALRAKDVTLETLARIDERLRSRGVRLGVVALPTRDQVYSRLLAGPDFDIDLPQAYLRIFTREKDIPFLDLLPILRRHVQRTNENLFVRGDTHLNIAGHRLVGESVADWFSSCVAPVR